MEMVAQGKSYFARPGDAGVGRLFVGGGARYSGEEATEAMMGDMRGGIPDPGRAAAQGEPGLTELIEVSVRRIVTSIVLAGGLIALSLYMQDYEVPQYQVTAADGRIVRVNTESGTVIACEGESCAIVLERGQELQERLPPRPPAKAEAAPALPAPAAAPGGNEAAPAAR
jgi:hypothetical protein